MMQPYYADGTASIFHGDCREILPKLPTAGYTLVTDPPYGIEYQSNQAQAGPSEKIVNDEDTALRDQVLGFWGDAPALVFGTWRVPRPSKVRQLLIWDKGDSPGMGDLDMPWGPGHEEIYVLGTGFKGKRRSNVIRVPTLAAGDYKRPDHPTPKPVPLMVQLLEYCPPLADIMDPFMGSGSTLRAAKDLGRYAVGIEINERYCEMAAKRLGQEVLAL